MKIYLLMKHIIKENYKYFLTLLLAYGFLGVLYHVSDNGEIQHYVIQVIAYALTLANSALLPNILFKNYYQQTNANHVASIPLKRLEIFSSLYFVGLGLSVVMILSYSLLTTLLSSSLSSFVDYSSALLVAFVYYYHLSLLAFWICGHFFFEVLVLGVLIFGPFIAYMVYHWALSTYDPTYFVLMSEEMIAKLLPGIGCGFYWFDIDATYLYGSYLFTAVIYLILSIVAVRYRPYEKTGQSMMFRILSYIVRSITVLLALSALFAIFGEILGAHEILAQIITCVILGVMVAYIVEMIYKKKTKVFHSIKYGILAAIVVFGSVHLGTKALEGYIPFSYDQIQLEIYDYYKDEFAGTLWVSDKNICEKIEKLNKDLMVNKAIDSDDYGNIFIRYSDENENHLFGRRYELSKALLEEIINHEEYHDLLVDTVTSQEKELLELVRKKVPIIFYGKDHYEKDTSKYVLDTDSEFYLFENYLKQELDAYHALDYIDVDDQEDDRYYFEYEYLLENNEKSYGWLYSEIIYNALAKTFNF